MTDALSLFDASRLYDGRPPHVADSPTSHDAALSVADKTPSWRSVVLAYIRVKSEGYWPHERGATCDEIEAGLELKHQTVSARIRELYLMGAIAKSGTRATRSGRQAVVWILK